MSDPQATDISETRSRYGLFIVGSLMIAIALFFDPIGSSPDTGLITLSTMQAKYLLGGMGIMFIAAGVWSAIRAGRRK